MIETFKTVNKISASMKLNIIVYYLKKIPLLGKLFKNLTYKNQQLKNSISIVSVIIKICSTLSSTILFLALTMGGPLFLLYRNNTLQEVEAAYWHIIILLFFISSAIINAGILTPSKEKFIFIKLMRINARDYIISTFLWANAWKIICSLPIYLIIGKLLAIPMSLSILMVISMNAFRCFGEMFHLRYYKIFGKFFQNNYVVYVGYMLMTLVLGYLPLVLKRPILFSTPVLYAILLMFLVLGIIGLIYMLTFKQYLVALNEANAFDKLSVDVTAISKASKFADVELKTKQFSEVDLLKNKYANKKGYDYLNEIFFERHKKIVLKPMIRQLVFIGLALVVCIICNFMMKGFRTQYNILITKSFSAFIFILYTISTAGRTTKAMFYNCDISLLRYGFYKKDKAVLATFRGRLNKLAFYNLIPALAIAFDIIVLGIICEIELSALLPVAVLVVSLSLFFTVHHLFLYYILQPYTTELDMKNPLFGIVNVVTYFICYSCIKLKTTSVWFLTFAVAATVIYIVIALIVVYKYAPKTFVVK